MLLNSKTGLKRFKGGILALVALLVLTLAGVTGCGNDNGNQGSQTGAGDTIMFGDFGWESSLFNNRVAQFIVEHGYGYPTDSLPGETIPLMQGLNNGDLDIGLEVWVQNAQEAYDQALASGNCVDLGTNFNDNTQGLFVPTYIIEGDAARGIEPMAPDLATIDDLPKYWELFKDPEDPNKGRFYSAVPGWGADEVLTDKFASYGLDEYYNVFRPGSGAALSSSIAAAYERGEPWFGYYWTPTWVFGLYDLTQIKEPEYDLQVWDDNYGCAFPAVDVNKVINKNLLEKAPEVAAFVEKYSLDSAQISEALAYMQTEDAEPEETAIWFLREKADIWTSWVPADIAQKVQDKLETL